MGGVEANAEYTVRGWQWAIDVGGSSDKYSESKWLKMWRKVGVIGTHNKEFSRHKPFHFCISIIQIYTYCN